jgi:hypothetical protein
MKHAPMVLAFFAPFLALVGGCNTAQVSQPAPIDAGPPCEALHPSLTCDGGGAVTPGACAGAVYVVLNAPDASNTIPAGNYPLGCSASFFYQDPASAQCNRAPACTCVPPDAGAADDAGDAQAPTEPGVWSCFPTQ